MLFAVRSENFAMVELFEDYRHEALLIRDSKGENPLFECAKKGLEDVFNWFMGSNEFF